MCLDSAPPAAGVVKHRIKLASCSTNVSQAKLFGFSELGFKSWSVFDLEHVSALQAEHRTVFYGCSRWPELEAMVLTVFCGYGFEQVLMIVKFLLRTAD